MPASNILLSPQGRACTSMVLETLRFSDILVACFARTAPDGMLHCLARTFVGHGKPAGRWAAVAVYRPRVKECLSSRPCIWMLRTALHAWQVLPCRCLWCDALPVVLSRCQSCMPQ